MKQLSLLFVALVLFDTTTLLSQSTKQMKTQIESDIKTQNYRHLGKLFKKSAARKVSLNGLQSLAKKNNCKPLLYAVQATKSAKSKAKRFDVSSNELLRLSFFIETRLSEHLEANTFYLPKKKTGLRQTIDYDPQAQAAFIVLKGKKATLGKGKSKVVTYALAYNKRRPKVVARAEQTEDMARELEITKKMQGMPGLYKTIGFAKHDKGRKNYNTIYSEIYSPGSLQTAFEKKHKLSLHEKMTAAFHILQGLESLHSNQIVHRDLGARNYLIHIPRGKPGRRRVKACIADLGRADYVERASLVKVQGNTLYTSPEGLFIQTTFKRTDYYSADIFAVGCVFYRLFYGKMAPWQNFSYVKDTHRSLKRRYKELVFRINRATKARRIKLAAKPQEKRTKKEAFELLILRMLHIDPSKRGNAKNLRIKMERII